MCHFDYMSFDNTHQHYFLDVRFMWVTTLIPPQSGAKFEIPQYLNMVTMAMELFR